MVASFEKVLALKASSLEKGSNAEIDFLDNQFFLKCSFSEKVDVVQKYLLWKSSSFKISLS